MTNNMYQLKKSLPTMVTPEAHLGGTKRVCNCLNPCSEILAHPLCNWLQLFKISKIFKIICPLLSEKYIFIFFFPTYISSSIILNILDILNSCSQLHRGCANISEQGLRHLHTLLVPPR